MTVIIEHHHKRIRIDVRRFLHSSLIIALTATLSLLTIDFLRFPECYISTWEYQLKNEVIAGNATSVEYYQTRYVNNGRFLFGEEN